MIWFDNFEWEENGLRISDVKGLFDFPELKNHGIDWKDRDYIQPNSRLQDYQYGSRKITLDCFMVKNTWDELQLEIEGMIVFFSTSGLKMMVLPSFSNRGYMVKLEKSTLFKPNKLFRNGKCVAEFKLQFEEPQPFNVQFSFVYPTTGQVSLDFTIERRFKSLSSGSTDQQFVTINFKGTTTEINLEQADYHFSNVISVVAGVPYPLVITGEIDSMDLIDLTSAGVVPVGIDTANLFIRNGEIRVV